ncbi:hypothetical protein QEW_4226 [Clostridioides difficile CD160]|nr:hypothetical protein QEW_4226 [Clostridioides difficile CD160]
MIILLSGLKGLKNRKYMVYFSLLAKLTDRKYKTSKIKGDEINETDIFG